MMEKRKVRGGRVEGERGIEESRNVKLFGMTLERRKKGDCR